MLHNHRYWIRAGLLLAAMVLLGTLASSGTVTQAQGGGTISYGAKVFGAIAADAPRVTYSFEGSAGDVITVIADNWTGTLDLRAELIAPNGLLIASSTQNTLDDNMQGAYLSAVLPDDGVYLLRVGSENETTGDFALTLLGRSAPDSTQLIFGQAVDVTLLPAADPLLFWFEAEDCPTSLIVSNLSEGQPFTYPFAVKVYDQRGQTVALLRGGEELEDWVTVTPRSGRYEVEVSSDHLLEAGNVRLLVTCAADAPGCISGQAGIPGVTGSGPQECPRCFVPGDPPESGGCPDLNFRAEARDVDDARQVTVSWDAMAGATGYAVTVYGRTADSGEMYLTHATWTPGDPTSFTWFLPRHYVAFRFLLRVAIGDDVVCVAETSLEFEVPPDGECPDLNLTLVQEGDDPLRVNGTWGPAPGAAGSVMDVYGTLPDGTVVPLAHMEYWGPGSESGAFSLALPEGYIDYRFVLRVYIGDLVCTAEAWLTPERPPDEQGLCELFVVTADIVAEGSREVTWHWTDYPGAEAYVVEWFEVLDDDTEVLQGSVLLGAGTTSFTTTLPPPSGTVDTWRLRVRVQLGGAFPCVAEHTLGLIRRIPVCGPFTLVETVHTATSSTIIWSDYPGALGYMMSVLDETGETMIPPFPLLLPPDQLSYVLEGLPPGTYLVRVGPWMEATFCEEELVLTFAPGQFPCLIRTNRADVRVRVGPGVDRAAFAFLTAGVEYPVIGFAYDAAGNRWWQLDRASVPGGMAALSLWVLDSEVEEIGDCDNVPPGEVPVPEPEQPGQPEQPEQPGGPGQWLPCGSCDTCGHPASECVTSPEGACLWDPATCVAPPQCYSLSVSTAGCPHGSVSVLSSPNCDGGWSPGSTVTLSANVGQCKLFNGWSGTCPGASGSSPTITVTMTSSCSVIASFY